MHSETTTGHTSVNVGPHLESNLSRPPTHSLKVFPSISGNPWFIFTNITKNPVRKWYSDMRNARILELLKVLFLDKVLKMIIQPPCGSFSIVERFRQVPFVNGVVLGTKYIGGQDWFALRWVTKLVFLRIGWRRAQCSVEPTKVSLNVTVGNAKLIWDNVPLDKEPTTEIDSSNPLFLFVVVRRKGRYCRHDDVMFLARHFCEF